ncbi:MAG: hypothetical protein K0S68_749 [Candidatus Saccharibacteria bacterium]|jgi:hypothetical protein|nr:hypothetical protein [Candidatus Saccharibacteria bacterium]
MDVRRQANDSGAYADVPAPARHAAAGKDGSLLGKILSVLLALAALAIVAWLGSRAIGSLTADAAVKGKAYQAVFLTNGQVYFGKVDRVDSSYVKLTDIYYLQVQQQVQPKDANAQQQPQVSLAKLGGELHGPEDVMFISRTQVLFWENLKDDGKVAKAIKDYKAGGNK